MNVLNVLRRNSNGVSWNFFGAFVYYGNPREAKKKRAIEKFYQGLETATGADKLGLPFLSFPLIVIIVI